MLDVWKTAAHYQLIHALALLALGLACVCFPPLQLRRTLVWVQSCWLAGSLLFSGSLYLLVLTGSASLGVITPVGRIVSDHRLAAAYGGRVKFAHKSLNPRSENPDMREPRRIRSFVMRAGRMTEGQQRGWK